MAIDLAMLGAAQSQAQAAWWGVAANAAVVVAAVTIPLTLQVLAERRKRAHLHRSAAVAGSELTIALVGLRNVFDPADLKFADLPAIKQDVQDAVSVIRLFENRELDPLALTTLIKLVRAAKDAIDVTYDAEFTEVERFNKLQDQAALAHKLSRAMDAYGRPAPTFYRPPAKDKKTGL